jgi:hypothetical protein
MKITNYSDPNFLIKIKSYSIDDLKDQIEELEVLTVDSKDWTVWTKEELVVIVRDWQKEIELLNIELKKRGLKCHI